MGRKKIEIKLIKDERTRLVTFAKRKSGLLRKAYELSVLCDCDIGMLIFSKSNRLYQYASKDLNVTMSRYTTTDHPHEYLRNEDIEKMYSKKCKTKAPDDSGDEGSSQFDFEASQTINKEDFFIQDYHPEQFFTNSPYNLISKPDKTENQEDEASTYHLQSLSQPRLTGVNSNTGRKGSHFVKPLNLNKLKTPSPRVIQQEKSETDKLRSNPTLSTANVHLRRQNSDTFKGIQIYSSHSDINDLKTPTDFGVSSMIEFQIKDSAQQNKEHCGSSGSVPLTSQNSLTTPGCYNDPSNNELLFNQSTFTAFQDHKTTDVSNPTLTTPVSIIDASTISASTIPDDDNTGCSTSSHKTLERENSLIVMLNDQDKYRADRQNYDLDNLNKCNPNIRDLWTGVSSSSKDSDKNSRKRDLPVNRMDQDKRVAFTRKKSK